MDISQEKIRTILPQREPFLFVDEVIEVEGKERVVAVKMIRGNEGYFDGHFPGRPVMPGVLIIEAMAQAAILLYSVCKPEIAITHPDYYLGKVKAEFIHPVFPGDKLVIEINGVKIIDSAGIVDAVAHVDEKKVAKASLVLGVIQK